MATLSVQDVNLVAAAPTFAAADVAGDQFVNDGKTYVQFKNTNASPRVVTIASPVACSQGVLHPVVVTVPATTGDVKVGPFPVGRFTNPTGFVTMTYDAVANLTVGVFSV